MGNNSKPQIIVKYKDNADTASVIEKVNKGLQNRSIKAQQTLAAVAARNSGRKIGLLTLDDPAAVQETVDTLTQDPGVEYAQPNYTFEALSLPAEPYLEQQWALQNTGQIIAGEPGLAGVDLHLAEVWDQAAAMAAVTVGLIDSNVDSAHPDLAGCIETGWDFYNDVALAPGSEDSTHGTQIAGIIAAQINGRGIVGAAPQARLIPLKCMEQGLAYTSDIINAIAYAKNAGVKIINCSWGGAQYNPALKEAMAENSDLLFICAAGNDGTEAKVYPAAFELPNVISVAAMNHQGRLVVTSNYGNTVHIAAPGEAIYTTMPGGNYAYASGTSMAAAYTTAAAAIYQGLNQAASAAQTAAALQNSATPAFQGQILFGSLNVAALLAEVNTAVGEESDFPHLPAEILTLLNTAAQYSALSPAQQELLCFALNVQTQNMSDCENAGLTIKESVWIAQVMSCLDLPVTAAAHMIDVFGDGKKAVAEAGTFALYTKQFPVLAQEPVLKELLQAGYAVKNIIGAYIASQVMAKDITAIIAKDSLAELVEAQVESDADWLVIQALSNSYGITAASILDYLSDTGATASQLEQLLAEQRTALGLLFLSDIKPLAATDDQIAAVPNAPFMYKTGINDIVNLNNGNLRHEEKIAYLPGRNGLDLDLSIVYNSAESYSITGGDELAKWPVKSLGYGWSMKFTKQLRSAGLTYFRFTDGSTYQYVNGALQGYKRSDITITNNNGAITLTYANGRKEAFDANGNLISITDRFGNSISFQYITNAITSGITTQVQIIDTLGAITQIQYDSAQKCYNIVLPDSTKTSLYLDSTSRMSKKVDALGRETGYSYELNNNYNILKNISYCTGLQSAFTYTYSTSGITGMLLTSMLCTDSGTNYLTENYAYSKGTNTYTTTVTDALNVVKAHVFDLNTHNKLSETVTDNNAIKSSTSYTYGNIDLPIQISTTVYNTAGNSRTSIQLYEYDNKGNAIAYWGPLAGGVKTDDYKVAYTYSPNYNILTGKTYNKDSSTSVSEQYSLTEDSKAVSTSQIYENDVLKAQTTYFYDQYGNVANKHEYASVLSKHEHTSDTEYLYTDYQYQDGDYLIRKASLSSLAQESTWLEAVETYAYDACGRILSVTDANGNTEGTAYDPLGRITTITHADGSTIQYLYHEQQNSQENSTTVTNERGYQTKYIYDGLGNIKQIIDLSSGVTLATYNYDTYLRLTEQTDGNGNKTEHSYDHLGRKTQKTVIFASYIIYKETYDYNEAYIKPGEQSSYLARTQKTIVGDANAPSIVTFVDTDKMGNTAQSGRMDGDTEYTDTFTYDYLGHKISELTAQDRLPTYAYYTNYYTTDLFGNVLTVCKDKPIVSIAWAALYAVLYGTGNGASAGAGIMPPEIKFNEVTYRYEYDLLSRKTSATDPKGNKTIYTYNLYGRLYSKETPFTGDYYSKETYDYDLNGNQTGRQITSDLPGGSGRLRNTEFVYDNRNRLKQTTVYDYNNTAYYITYGYDKAGNKTSMTTGNGKHTTTYEYDARNRLFKETDPLGYVQTYTYDNNNNLTQAIDRNKNQIDNHYNALNQLTQSTVTTPDGKTQTDHYGYTASGSILTSYNENLTTTYQYDNLGRMSKRSNSNTTELSYGYDLADNRTSYQLTANVTGNVQQNVVYTYDKQNRLTEVWENGVNAVTYTYDLNGNRATATNHGNGVVSTYTYNNANLLTDLQNKTDAATISQCQYTYYLDGNQATKIENGVQTQYIYDGLGQLITEKETGGNTKQYTYNESGNRSRMDVTGAETYSIIYSYDANDRLTQEQTNRTGQNSQITTYSYDANGNQITKTAASGTENRQYNGRNKITSSSAPGVQATYTYQADGLRLTKTVNGITTTHVWDGQNIIAEFKR